MLIFLARESLDSLTIVVGLQVKVGGRSVPRPTNRSPPPSPAELLIVILQTSWIPDCESSRLTNSLLVNDVRSGVRVGGEQKLYGRSGGSVLCSLFSEYVTHCWSRRGLWLVLNDYLSDRSIPNAHKLVFRDIFISYYHFSKKYTGYIP